MALRVSKGPERRIEVVLRERQGSKAGKSTAFSVYGDITLKKLRIIFEKAIEHYDQEQGEESE